MRRLLILAVLLAAACNRETPQAAPEASPDPSVAASNAVTATSSSLIPPITARGNEPFWAAYVEQGTLTLTRPDHAPITRPVTSSGPLDHLTWSGNEVTLVVVTGPCSDGMSDLSYKMSAELKLGSETLKGCAFFKANPPKQP